MRLNELKPTAGSRPDAKRVGRGTGSGDGKTCGRGHKGQKSRSGGFHKTGFEGGQMPLQRRLPKRGFKSRVGDGYAEVRLSEIEKLDSDEITLQTLIAANVVPATTHTAKVILSGELTRKVTTRGLRVTKGAVAAIEKAGGTVEKDA